MHVAYAVDYTINSIEESKISRTGRELPLDEATPYTEQRVDPHEKEWEAVNYQSGEVVGEEDYKYVRAARVIAVDDYVGEQ